MTDHPHIQDEILREVVAGTTASTGGEFLDAFVKHLARALGTKCAWVTELLPQIRQLRALSFWMDDNYVRDYQYDLAGTPCEAVIDAGELVHFPDRLIELFPDDADLPPLGAVSYIGVPLIDVDGLILGHMAIMHDQPLPPDPRAEAVFRIFAGRAGAELRRMRRDRDLQEREQRLSLLISSARDAIFQLDSELHIRSMNEAAQSLFSCQAAHLEGQPFDVFLDRPSRGKLALLVSEMSRTPQGEKSVWIPDGLHAIGASGNAFPAEATVSRFMLDGVHHYSVILRNIDERSEAQERIRTLLRETAGLRQEIDALRGFSEILGESPALQSVLTDVERVAAGETTVLITGETGTGKELLAHAVHMSSPRAKKALIKVNCAAIPATLQESEFFGHEKGAFTGATQTRAGRFLLADGGSLFLDEVGELPLDLQAKLLRVLQEGEFEAVGSSKTTKVDVRVIAATNRDLETMVERGEFRQDLLYRLNVFPIAAPALREREDDVLILAENFVGKFSVESGLAAPELSPADRARLRAYDWPGNIRELANVIERALITSEDGRSLNLQRALPDLGSVNPTSPKEEDPGRVLTDFEMRDLERANLERALAQSGGKVSGPGGAAELLGLKPNTLASRIKALGAKAP